MSKNYMKPTNLYEEVKRRCNELKDFHALLEKKKEKYPPGRIHIIRNKNRMQYYLRKEKSDRMGTYLSKRKSMLIQTYLQKKYDEDILKLLEIEIENLKQLYLQSEQSVSKIQNLYSNQPQEIRQYITPIDISEEEYAREWLATPYVGKEIGEDVPEYYTEKGERVRSKSELNIANALYRMHIPYKYECPLVLKSGRIIYPDFTILDMKMRREVYWEHRGMMDDVEYSRHAIQRNKQYLKEGLFLGENVILTEETSTSPLGTSEIAATIQHFIL